VLEGVARNSMPRRNTLSDASRIEEAAIVMTNPKLVRGTGKSGRKNEREEKIYQDRKKKKENGQDQWNGAVRDAASCGRKTSGLMKGGSNALKDQNPAEAARRESGC